VNDKAKKSAPVTAKTLAVKIDKIEKDAETRFKDAEIRFAALGRQLRNQAQILALTDAEVVRNRLNSMDSAMRVMDRRQQVMVLRITVATELLYYRHSHYPKTPVTERIAEVIVRAFDNSDEWWFARRDLTIHQWFEEFEKWVGSGAEIVRLQVAVTDDEECDCD
jgi:hypothetical protein